MPLIQIPYTLDCKHYISVASIGSHACIYSRNNRDELLKKKPETITDWDLYNFLNFNFLTITHIVPLK